MVISSAGFQEGGGESAPRGHMLIRFWTTTLVDRQRYDLAILDVCVTRLGWVDGLEVLREIQRRDHATSVIVLSAYISPEVEAEARALGADIVVRKPQALPDLAQLAYVLIGSRPSR